MMNGREEKGAEQQQCLILEENNNVMQHVREEGKKKGIIAAELEEDSEEEKQEEEQEEEEGCDNAALMKLDDDAKAAAAEEEDDDDMEEEEEKRKDEQEEEEIKGAQQGSAHDDGGDGHAASAIATAAEVQEDGGQEAEEVDDDLMTITSDFLHSVQTFLQSQLAVNEASACLVEFESFLLQCYDDSGPKKKQEDAPPVGFPLKSCQELQALLLHHQEKVTKGIDNPDLVYQQMMAMMMKMTGLNSNSSSPPRRHHQHHQEVQVDIYVGDDDYIGLTQSMKNRFWIWMTQDQGMTEEDAQICLCNVNSLMPMIARPLIKKHVMVMTQENLLNHWQMECIRLKFMGSVEDEAAKAW